VTETCRWSLRNKITFIHPRAFVGLLKNSTHLISMEHETYRREWSLFTSHMPCTLQGRRTCHCTCIIQYT